MLIAFEGPDGTGKTSTCEKLRDVINAQNDNDSCVVISSPYCNNTGLFAHKLLKNNNLRKITSMFLYLAYFAEAKKQIVDAINENKYVLLDRYFLSTYIYNCFMHNETKAHITGVDISAEINSHIPNVNNGVAIFFLYLASIVERSSIEHLPLLKGHAEYAFELIKKNNNLKFHESSSDINKLMELIKGALKPYELLPENMEEKLLDRKVGITTIAINEIIALPKPDISIIFNTPINSQDDNGIDKEEFNIICTAYKSNDILDKILGKNTYIIHDNAKTLVEYVKHFQSEEGNVLHNVT